MKETTESNTSCSFLDLHLFNDNGELKFRVYDKRDDFNFEIVNYPHLSSNIPSGPAYGVYISRLIAFLRICNNFTDFSERHKLLVTKLIKQGYSKTNLKKVLIKFQKRYDNILKKYHVDFSLHINKVLSECT